VTGDSCSVSVKAATQGDVEFGVFWSVTDGLWQDRVVGRHQGEGSKLLQSASLNQLGP